MRELFGGAGHIWVANSFRDIPTDHAGGHAMTTPTMDDNQIRQRIEMLRTVWPEECQLIGDDTLYGLALDPSGFALPHGGVHFDLTPVLQVLAYGLSIFASLLAIAKIMQASTDKDNMKRELLQRLHDEHPRLPAEFTIEKQEKIAEITVRVALK
jgi:hypothetical protein